MQKLNSKRVSKLVYILHTFSNFPPKPQFLEGLYFSQKNWLFLFSLSSLPYLSHGGWGSSWTPTEVPRRWRARAPPPLSRSPRRAPMPPPQVGSSGGGARVSAETVAEYQAGAAGGQCGSEQGDEEAGHGVLQFVQGHPLIAPLHYSWPPPGRPRRLLATRTSSVYRGVTAPALHSQHHRHLSSPLPPQSKPRRGGAASVVRRVTSSASSRSA